MQGTILRFDNETHTGMISGTDGNRYSFTRVNWTAKKDPKEGMSVDFGADGKEARDIVVVAGVGAAGSSQKGRTVTSLLCFFLGALGVHRFYVGKIGTGILMLLTLGGVGIWALIDFIVFFAGRSGMLTGTR